MATSVFEKLETELTERQAKADSAFHSLAARIAAGNEVGTDETQGVIDAAGKSIDDLREAVKLIERRNELRQQIEAAQTAESERPDIESKISAAGELLKKAREKHAETVRPLQARLQQIGDLQTRAATAKRELLQSCPDDLQAELDENMKSRQELDERIKKLRGAIGAQQTNLTGAESRPFDDQSKEDAKAARLRIDELLGQVAELQEQQAKLVDAESEILQRVYSNPPASFFE